MAPGTTALLLLVISQCISAALITNLPGAPAANFKQYSGYYTVGATKNHQLHYWLVFLLTIFGLRYFPTDPVLLWLTGGPGCSGLSALLTEWGPFMVNDDGATLRNNPYSWNTKASVLTLESPAGVGYSFATDNKLKTGDDQLVDGVCMGQKLCYEKTLFAECKICIFSSTRAVSSARS
ncbi:serine carboxypeptidase, partial [Oesophagostomum dentatum]